MRESLDTPLVTAYDDVDVVCCLDDEASEVAEVVVPQRDDLTGERAPACMVVALFFRATLVAPDLTAGIFVEPVVSVIVVGVRTAPAIVSGVF